MDSKPDDEALLEAALELTDHVPAPRSRAPGPVDPHAPLDATSRSLDRIALLSDVAAAYSESGAHEPSAAPPPPPALFTWGSLRVIGRLGEGAYGEVFLAWDPALQREVALKLRRAQAGTLRWLDEARSLARVRHPSVLVVYGADLRDERAGIWSERIRGRTLEELLAADGPFAPREAARVAREVAAALDAVHHSGMVHGDVTTRNVMLEDVPAAQPVTGAGAAGTGSAPHPGAAAAKRESAARRVVLMDFGTASDQALASDLGTPLAAAPELIAGGRPTPASDVYALGVLLFRLLTGRYPIEAGSLEELRERHAKGQRESLGALRRGVPAALARIVERALEREPARRFASAALLRDALARSLGEFVPIVPLRVALPALLGAVALVLISVALLRQVRRQDTNYFPPPPPVRFAMPTTPAWTTPVPDAEADCVWHLSLNSDFNHDGRRDAVVTGGGYSLRVPSGGRAMMYMGGPGGLARVPTVVCEGEERGQRIGEIIACPGDVDGDGWPDVLVGTTMWASEPGRLGELRLLRGGPNGVAARDSWRVAGDSVYTAFGDGLERIGDINGDRFDDIAVPEHDRTDVERNQGRVLVYFGGPQGPHTRPDQVLGDELQNERFGHYVCGVGDVNGDGFGDVMVGAPQWQQRDREVGCALLYLGGKQGLQTTAPQRIKGEGDGDLVGNSGAIAGLGDLDGDGYADVAIGFWNRSGRAAGIGQVRIYRGGPHGLEPRPVWSCEGFGSNASFGKALACGDLNGDGRPDLVVGSPGYGHTVHAHAEGAVYVFLGLAPGKWFAARPDWRVSSDQPGSGFGWPLGVGDVNGDGAADLLVSAPLWHLGTKVIGREFLYLGVPRRRRP